MAQGIPARLTPREGRKFGLLLAAGFGTLAAISGLRGHAVAPLVLGGLAAGIGLAGLLLPERLGPIYRGWMRLGLALSKVTTPIILGIVYFVVITPVGLLMRALRRNPLRNRSEVRGSYWVARSAGTAPNEGMKRQF